jgi:hypothetical protein
MWALTEFEFSVEPYWIEKKNRLGKIAQTAALKLSVFTNRVLLV